MLLIGSETLPSITGPKILKEFKIYKTESPSSRAKAIVTKNGKVFGSFVTGISILNSFSIFGRFLIRTILLVTQESPINVIFLYG